MSKPNYKKALRALLLEVKAADAPAIGKHLEISMSQVSTLLSSMTKDKLIRWDRKAGGYITI